MGPSARPRSGRGRRGSAFRRTRSPGRPPRRGSRRAARRSTRTCATSAAVCPQPCTSGGNGSANRSYQPAAVHTCSVPATSATWSSSIRVRCQSSHAIEFASSSGRHASWSRSRPSTRPRTWSRTRPSASASRAPMSIGPLCPSRGTLSRSPVRRSRGARRRGPARPIGSRTRKVLPSPRVGLDQDVTAVHLGDPPRDGQAETGAGDRERLGVAGPVERREQVGLVDRRRSPGRCRCRRPRPRRRRR